MQTTTSQQTNTVIPQPQAMTAPAVNVVNNSVNNTVNKNVIASTTKAPKPPKQPAARSSALVAFLNNLYKDQEQEIKFKGFEGYVPSEKKPNKKTQDIILDVTKFKGLNEVREALMETPSQPMTKIIERTFDLTMRSVLDIADQYDLTDKSFNILVQSLIPQLNLPVTSANTDPLDCITKYLTNNEYFQVKAYNKVFPHPVIDTTKDAKLLNLKYLQQPCTYQNRVLQMMIGEGKSEQVILAELLESIVSSIKFSDKVKKEDYPLYQKQLRNPKIFEIVMGDNKEFEKVAAKLHILDLQGTEKPELLTPEMRKYVLTVIRELNSIKNLFRLTVAGFQANPTSNPMECLKKYSEFLNKISEFVNDKLKYVSSTKAEIDSVTKAKILANKENKQEIDIEFYKKKYELFIRYFVETCKFIEDILGLHDPTSPKTAFNAFIGELRKVGTFKLSNGLRKDLLAITTPGAVITQELIDNIVNQHYVEELGNTKSLDPFNDEVYSKIGKLIDVKIDKQFRIAVGVAIMYYVQHQIEVIKAGCNYKKIKVIVKA